MLPLGTPTAAFAAGLVAAIILYDIIHKHTDLAAFLMGGCRFLLYLTAGASAKRGQIGIVVVPALDMAAYVTGLSLFARQESDTSNPDAPLAQMPSSSLAKWGVAVLGIALLAVPLVLNAISNRSLHWDRLAVLAGAGIWILWCLRHGLRRNDPNFSRGVSGLLAGIVLIDWLAAPVLVPLQPALFAGLFLLALILQKIVPAT
jgi:4-hydroxybenzoate polyprenyltransferase